MSILIIVSGIVASIRWNLSPNSTLYNNSMDSFYWVGFNYFTYIIVRWPSTKPTIAWERPSCTVLFGCGSFVHCHWHEGGSLHHLVAGIKTHLEEQEKLHLPPAQWLPGHQLVNRSEPYYMTVSQFHPNEGWDSNGEETKPLKHWEEFKESTNNLYLLYLMNHPPMSDIALTCIGMFHFFPFSFFVKHSSDTF